MKADFCPLGSVADKDRLAALEAYGLLEACADVSFDGAVLLARALCGTPAALVSFVVEDRQWFGARSGFGPTQTPLQQSVCAHALTVPSLLVINDLCSDPRTLNNTLVTGKPNLRFYAGAPLRTPEGHTLGTICVLDTVIRPAGLLQEEAEGLQALAEMIMAQLKLRRSLLAREAEIIALKAHH